MHKTIENLKKVCYSFNVKKWIGGHWIEKRNNTKRRRTTNETRLHKTIFIVTVRYRYCLRPHVRNSVPSQLLTWGRKQ